ncbi:hypothetical protein [Chroococcidiopsis sp. TS-821]|uniref:hypothetical protein n=1 Tax=Chroococcidiopsis sp. TS-821 TaxID=1378066 RepID=UPI000CEEC920|nr:hypothetical protein [Chroococcidiopsis sp. TS-821]PPS45634.1 hypothetical protein B1A85_05165 [Chroococcidiopsis sp. TS-821]
MNAALPKLIKSAYRKEPLPSVLVTMGAVDAVIGGLGDRWSLFAFGLVTVGIAIGLRWWLLQQQRPYPTESMTTTPRYLPPSSSHQALPVLKASKKRPPR